MFELDLKDRLLCKIGNLQQSDLNKLDIFILGLEAGQKIVYPVITDPPDNHDERSTVEHAHSAQWEQPHAP
jgi:hypothetical protein